MSKIVNTLFCFFTVLWVVLSHLPGESAQTVTSGAIEGFVYEEGTKLPRVGIPNVVVSAKNTETGLSRSLLTNREGKYFFPVLPIGTYQITGNCTDPCQGYENTPNSSVPIIVRIKEPSKVIPPPIELRKIGTAAAIGPPPATSTARETEGGQLVNTANATRSQSFDRRQLISLPLPGIRSFDDLAFLAPGVVPPPQAIGGTVGPGLGPGVGTSGQFSVNGLRSRSNNFTVDGSDNNDEDIGVRRQGFTSLVPQSIESVQEYQITTLLPEPQYGRNLGAQADAVSRSGGTEYHGTLYGFITDKRLKARDAFDLTGGPATFPITRARDGAPVLLDGKPLAPANPVDGENPFTRAQYGAVFGGPIVKEKTHFFLSFEHQDINASKESHFAVPTVADRGLFGSGDEGIRVGNVPSFPTSVNGDAFFSYFPFPNNPRGPYGLNTFTQILPASAHGMIASVKLDQNFKAFNREHIFTGRYNFTDDDTILPTTGEALFSSLRPRVRTQNLSLFLNSTPSTRTANQMRVSYGRTNLAFKEVRDPFLLPAGNGSNGGAIDKPGFLLNTPVIGNMTVPGGPLQLNTLCIRRNVAMRVIPCTAPTAGPPLTTELVNGLLGQVMISGFSPIGVDVFNLPQGRSNNTFQYADTFIYNLRKQRFIAGGDFRRNQLNSFLDRNFRPLAVFSGAVDLANRRLGDRQSQGFILGRDFAATGAPTGVFQAQALVSDSTIGLRYWQTNYFLSDEIRIRPNFALTLGVRYELNTVPTDVNNRIERTFDSPEVQKFISIEKNGFPDFGIKGTGVSGLERFLAGRKTIYQRDSNNVAPHIALAWDPAGNGKTSIRAGYSIYYDQIPGAIISQSRNVFPSFITLNFAGLIGETDVGGNGAFFFTNPSDLSNPPDGSLPRPTLNTFPFTRDDIIVLLAELAAASNFSAGTGFVLPAADLITPYSQHWGLTVEREIKRDFLFSAAYVGTRGVHLLRFATPNLGPNAIPRLTSVGLDSRFGVDPTVGPQPIFQGFATPPKGRRPFPLLGAFTSIESDANSTYHALQLQVNKRFSRGIQFTAAYTWSHAIDEVSDIFDLAGTRTLPQDSFNRRAERGDANFDVRHRFVYSFIWDLPIFEKSKLLGGWQMASIGTFQTGQPYSVLAAIDVNQDGNLTDRVAPGTTNPLQAGASRNLFRAPGIATVDLAVTKAFKFSDRHRLEFRSEFFNLFNRTHFGIPVHQLFFGGFGLRPASEKIFVDTRLPARTIQFALKYNF